MTSNLANASLQDLFAEIHRRAKDEFTAEEFTTEFWDHIKIDEDGVKEIAAQHDMEVLTDDEILEAAEAEFNKTQLFALLVRLAYWSNTSTIRELNELQFEARHELHKHKQHHGNLI